MKVFLKILLVFYILLATAAAGLFGYTYFSGERIAFIDNIVNEFKKDEQTEANGSLTIEQFKLKLENFYQVVGREFEYENLNSGVVRKIDYSDINQYFNKNQSALIDNEVFVSYSGEYELDGEGRVKDKHDAIANTLDTSDALEYIRMVCNITNDGKDVFTKPIFHSYDENNSMKIHCVVNNKVVLIKYIFNGVIEYGNKYTETSYISLVFDEQDNCSQIIYAYTYTREDKTDFIYNYKIYNVNENVTYVLKENTTLGQTLKTELFSEITSFKNSPQIVD